MRVVVHSAGKCGSVAMAEALKGNGYEVLHTHRMTELRRRDEYFIFTPIRELVSRNISAYFENCYKGGQVTFDDFYEGLKERGHYKGASFFDNRIKPYWGIDVYKKPFNWRKGWQIYTGDDVKMLVIRYENFDKWDDAFLAMMGTKAPKLQPVNVTKHKEYKRFLKEVNVPRYYYEEMWRTKFYRHFYPDRLGDYGQ